jgi:aubergine-like protein
VNFDPVIPDNSRISGKILKGVRDQIKAELNFIIHCGGSIYSYTLMKDDQIYDSELDGQNYKVKIAWSKTIKSNDIELYSFYSLFFKNLMKRMSFERVGRNCFNPSAAVKISNQGLEVWPGFYSAMQKLESGPLIMIDMTNKVIRSDKVLAFI